MRSVSLMKIRGVVGVLILAMPGCEDSPPLPPLPPATQAATAPAPTAPSAAPKLEPPHGGTLTALDGDRGYVELVRTEEGNGLRIHLLTGALAALTGIQDLSVTAPTPEGPMELALAACSGEALLEDKAGDCVRLTEADLRRVTGTAVLRFRLGDEPQRAALALDQAVRQDAEPASMPGAEAETAP